MVRPTSGIVLANSESQPHMPRSHGSIHHMCSGCAIRILLRLLEVMMHSRAKEVLGTLNLFHNIDSRCVLQCLSRLTCWGYQ
eukprot:590648-Amphidinium_carterae.1